MGPFPESIAPVTTPSRYTGRLVLFLALAIGCSDPGTGAEVGASPPDAANDTSAPEDALDVSAPQDLAQNDAVVDAGDTAEISIPDDISAQDAAPDASNDVSPDVIADSPEDTTSDALTDTPGDLPVDAMHDTPPDVCQAPTEHAAPPLVRVNVCNALSYGLYANRGEGEVAVQRLPDFSHAGYRGGGVALPDVPVVQELASPSGQDDGPRIQAALDEIAARDPDERGLRGALLLRRGQWRVHQSLYLRASGMVLRGEGQGSNGTRIIATRAERHDLIVLQGAAPALTEVEGTRQPITADAPVGTHTVQVAAGQGFSPGDIIAVERTPNQAWIDALDTGQWGWTPGSYAIAHERRIAAVEGDVITLDVPLVDTIEARFGGGAVYVADTSGRIRQTGVEDLRLISAYNGPQDEDHGWKAVRLQRVTDSWVRRVTAQHFGYSAVSIEEASNFNTVEEVAMLAPISQVTGGRRYAFNLSDGTGNLFQRCYSESSRHDFVSGARTTGPNVWLDCYSARSSNDDGPHHRWATGLLFDNVASRQLHVENRKDSGSGHGWSGAQTMFWNSMAQQVICDAPPGAMNWTVGTAGAEAEGRWAPEEPPGWWASEGQPRDPRSLYLKQLEDRLGPAAVQAVTTPAQRDGRIWGQLAAWAGDGSLVDVEVNPGDPECAQGIRNGRACCAASCGACGGQGCGGRPGGASACCLGGVSASGRSCAATQAPCILDPDFAPIAP